MSKKQKMNTKTLASCALLAAMGVVFARLFGMMPNEASRFSIEAVPTFIAGILFGPMAGALVGFTADAVGCLFSGYGYNPLFALPPILYGLTGGIFQPFLAKKMSFLRLLIAILPAIVLGSIFYQSWALTFVYSKDGAFLPAFLTRLGARGVQFTVTMIVDVLVTHLLFKSNVFRQARLWPPKSN